MNIKDLMVTLVFSLSLAGVVNYFFFAKKEMGQYEFVAPLTAAECAPLNRMINFVEEKRVVPHIETVQTNWGSVEFSTHGASITRLEFKRVEDHATHAIGTIFPQEERENQAFLVALNGSTPYVYRFIERHDGDDRIELVFEGTCDIARITKIFTVYTSIHQMDVAVAIEPTGDAKVQARLVYPAPFMPALKDKNQIAGELIYGTDTFKKLYRDNIKLDTFWVTPSLFGVENKYFMHTLVRDDEGFVQRAYYRFVGQNQLQAMLEGPETNNKASWTLSFYLGPKESHAMLKVDQRLEKSLEYSGFWAPISRLLLLILNWLFSHVHNYGWAIVVLTILVKLLLLPFALRSERSMKNRAETQKKLQYLKQKYKDDPQARSHAELEFIKKHGMGLGGCLPMFAQVPIFFGLSRVLSSAIELYGASFLWMKDLSMPDPYYVLPTIVVIGMLGSMAGTADAKQRLPMVAMAILFGAFSISFSAGLVLYLALSGVLNIIQTRITNLFKVAG